MRPHNPTRTSTKLLTKHGLGRFALAFLLNNMCLLPTWAGDAAKQLSGLPSKFP